MGTPERQGPGGLKALWAGSLSPARTRGPQAAREDGGGREASWDDELSPGESLPPGQFAWQVHAARRGALGAGVTWRGTEEPPPQPQPAPCGPHAELSVCLPF